MVVSASIGIVPMHSGSDGKNKLGSISKTGRSIFTLPSGAQSAIYHVGDKTDGLSCWIRKQLKHNSVNKTTVAQALSGRETAIQVNSQYYVNQHQLRWTGFVNPFTRLA